IHKRHKETTKAPLKKPSIKFRSVPKEEITVSATSNVVLQCEAGGNPPPKIHWLKDGERIAQSVDELTGVEDIEEGDVNAHGVLGLSFTRSKLYLDCVQPQDNAVYTCVADNPYNRIASNTRLTIVNSINKEIDNEAAASDNSLSLCVSKKNYGSPARIFMWTHTRLEMIGSSVQLYCRSSGVPQPIVSWSGPNEDTTIMNSEKYQILENGDLVVNDLSWDDMGSYTCHVRNQHDSDKISTFLYPTLVSSRSHIHLV
ncbi:neural/ectodermal development factor IMP-L2-like protein, partial [Dinothrombium tinctorium]